MENQDISSETTFTLSLADHIDIFFLQGFCLSYLVSIYCLGDVVTCQVTLWPVKCFFFSEKYTLVFI